MSQASTAYSERGRKGIYRREPGVCAAVLKEAVFLYLNRHSKTVDSRQFHRPDAIGRASSRVNSGLHQSDQFRFPLDTKFWIPEYSELPSAENVPRHRQSTPCYTTASQYVREMVIRTATLRAQKFLNAPCNDVCLFADDVTRKRALPEQRFKKLKNNKQANLKRQ